MRCFIVILIVFTLMVPVFSKKSPFPSTPAITNGKQIKIKGKANDTFVNEISRFPTVIVNGAAGSYSATVQLSTFHDVVTKYVFEPEGAPAVTSSWSTPQKDHMRVYSNLIEGKKYKIKVIMTYNNYKSRPDTYYTSKPLIIRPPMNLTDRSNKSIFISKPYDHLASDFNVKEMKSVDLSDPAVRKKIRMIGIQRHKDQRKAKIWEYAATGGKSNLNKSKDFAKNAPKIGGDKIKGIKKKLKELVGGKGSNPKPVPPSTATTGGNQSVFAMSLFRKVMLDKNNDGIPDIKKNEMILFPEMKKEGPDAYVNKNPEYIFKKIRRGNYSDFNDFLKKAGSRRYEITRKYVIPGDPPSYFTIKVIEYYPLKIAVDYDNVPGAPGKIRYIELWRNLWGSMYMTNLVDEVRTTPLIPSVDTAGAIAGTRVDQYKIVQTIKIKPLPYPE